MEEDSSSEQTTRRQPVRNPCSICNEQGDGLHFGAEACRACAAFFRRTVALNKQYNCRNGGTCDVHSNVRIFCRLCRYQKCLQAGMRKNSVQRYRDRTGSKDSDDSCPSPEGLEGGSEVAMLNLKRLQEQYKLLDERRNAMHNRRSSSVFEKADPVYANYRMASEVNVREFPALADFVADSFPQLRQLSEDQQKLLFKHFSLPFMLLESGYFCSVSDRTDVIILGSGDYINLLNPNQFYSESPEYSMMSGSEAATAMAPSFDIFHRNVLQPMLQLKVDEVEFLALLAFSLWDQGIEDQSRECEMLASRVRETVTAELIYYHRIVKKLREPAERMSGLMILLPSLQRAVNRFRQDVEMSRFFSYDADDQFYKIICGRY